MGSCRDLTAASCCNCKSEQAALRQKVDESSESLLDESGTTFIAASSTAGSTDISTRSCAGTGSDEDPWTYSGPRLQALEFPIGGFGTGQILLQGDGTLQGWTITNTFHNPEYSPLYNLPGNLFGVQATVKGNDPLSYVLQTPQNYTLQNCKKHTREESHVTPAQVRRMKELPGIPSLTAKCQYPIATLNYEMPPEFPVEIQLECMSPLIPGNTKDSSLPLAIFTFTVHNPSDQDFVQVSLLQSTLNFLGWDGKSSVDNETDTAFWHDNVNTPVHDKSCDGGFAGWIMTSQNATMDSSRQGSLALIAIRPRTGECCSDWNPGLLESDSKSEAYLWQNFCQGKIHDPATYTTPTEPSIRGHTYIGGVTQTFTLPPKATQSCQFILAWYFPNRPSYSDRPHLPSPILGNYYQNWFTSAEDVMRDAVGRIHSLVTTTRTYVEILYSTTIPWELLESAAGRVSVLRSPSMFWTQQGLVLGNEGNACCPLNCSHVYGYSMLMERLFPEWAKNMLQSNFVANFDPQNGCSMRFGTGGFAIDGSLASVIKVYLVVRQADSKLQFLKQVWPNVKRQIQIVLEQFVKDDNDCVIRCLQQNTYDTAMQGANTFIGTYWITALRAAANMAEMMGEGEFAQQCRQNSQKAAKAYERICWKEEYQYYIADVDETTCTNSYGTGCFIDQLCAVGLSLAVGLGNVLSPEHEAAARRSIYQHNQVVKPPFQDFQKHFYDGDKGVRVNTYPYGKLPGCYVYDNLVSTGFSYPVIAAMIHDNNTEMALEWARNIRNRHSGVNRSPWNEPECGLWYVRAMAAWNLFDQACGFNYDSTMGALSYAPKFNAQDFSCFVIVEDGWGQFRQQLQKGTWQLVVKCHHGVIRLKSLATNQIIDFTGLQILATLDDIAVPSTLSPPHNAIHMGPGVTIRAGSTLVIDLVEQNGLSKIVAKSPSTFQRRFSWSFIVVFCFLCFVWLSGVWDFFESKVAVYLEKVTLPSTG